MCRFVLAAFAWTAIGVSASRSAQGDEPFVDRPLTLPSLHLSADAGLGFGQYEAFAPDPDNPQITRFAGRFKVGWGTYYAAAVGIPFLGEFGADVGIRFGRLGIAAQADHFGRLFDPVTNEPGFDVASNPEFYLRRTLVSVPSVELGLELRAIVPTASTCSPPAVGDSVATACDFALTPGVPARFHWRVTGSLGARIDTALYVPFVWGGAFAIQVPCGGCSFRWEMPSLALSWRFDTTAGGWLRTPAFRRVLAAATRFPFAG